MKAKHLHHTAVLVPVGDREVYTIPQENRFNEKLIN